MTGEAMPKESKLIEKFDGGEEIELMEHRAMIYLPENSVEVKIIARVYEGGEIRDVLCILTLDEIRKSFQKADDGYIDDDDVFVLTEKGKAEADRLAEAGLI